MGLITTVAGNGDLEPGYGGDGGLATSAALNNPVGMAVDAAGNLYIADSGNDAIRKVSATSGIMTTVAGTIDAAQGYSGDGGLATSAELFWPMGVAADANGNLYIADTYNYVIRKVSAATGVITTVAGDGSPGYCGDGGPATSAELFYPMGVALDAAGNLYIADAGDSSIREVSATTGVITRVAGNQIQGYGGDGGPATSAQLNNPNGMAVDAAWNLYIADQQNARIREVRLANATQAATSTSLTASANPTLPASPVTFTATAATAGPLAPVGTVTFNDGPIVLGMGMRNSSGVATYTTSDLAPGTHLITAFYGGDPNNLASTSGALSQTIAGNAPVPVLTSLSPSSIYAGGSAFTMTVNGSSFVSTSTVLWNGGSRTTTFISSTVLQAAVTAADIAAEGTATVTVSTPAPGGGVSNGLAFDIVPAITSTTLSSTPSPSAYGQMVRFTAAFTSFWCGGGSGTIALIDGTNTLSTGMVFANGIVSFDIGTLSAGTHQITARYSGSTSCAPSASSLTQNVTGIKVTASVTAANKSYDGTNTAIITGCKLIGVLPVDRGNGRERSGGNRFFGLHPQR